MQQEASLCVEEEQVLSNKDTTSNSIWKDNYENSYFSPLPSCVVINDGQQVDLLSYLLRHDTCKHDGDSSRYLYGRENELEQLKEAYERCCLSLSTKSSCNSNSTHSNRTKHEFILLSGAAGTGKTKLATIVREDVVNNKGGYFISGKYVPFFNGNTNHHEPTYCCAAIVAAFTDLIQMVMESENDQSRKQIKEAIMHTVGVQDIGMLVDILPAIQPILREVEKTPSSSLLRKSSKSLQKQTATTTGAATASKNNGRRGGRNAQTRIRRIFRNFVRGIVSSLQRPVVLFMDDLHWAGATSLDLIELLATDNNSSSTRNHRLIVLATCRPNAISNETTTNNTHNNLVAMLHKIENENNNTDITNIQVNNLSIEATNSLIADVLKLPPNKCQAFTEVVFAKTDGNVYYLLHLLQSLYEDDMLKLVVESSKLIPCSTDNNTVDTQTSQQWVWDQMNLSNYQIDNGINGLMMNKIRGLPSNTRRVLTTAACIGYEFDDYILGIALLIKQNDENINFNVADDLLHAVDIGLILPNNNVNNNGRHHTATTNNVYTFSHDSIQQAAYALIPMDQKETTHLSIAEFLLRNLSEEELDMYLLLVVDQLSRVTASGLKGHLALTMQYSYLAAMCLQSGEKSMSLGDFQMATTYLWRGIDLLKNNAANNDRDHWNDQYILSLNLYNAVAEAELFVPDLQKMELAVEEVLEKAHTFHDRIRAYSAQIYASGARDKPHEAITIGLFVLNQLGQPLPVHPNKANTLIDIAKTEIMLRGKTNRFIVSLPDAADAEIVEAMSILNLITAYAFLVRKELFPFIACRLVRLSLKYGLCAISAYGFAVYGLVCCRLGKIESANRWGDLAVSILERYKTTAIQWMPRVYSMVYGMIAYFKQPMHSLLDKVWSGYQVGFESGDIENATIAINFYAKYAFFVGMPLSRLDRILMAYVKNMESYKQGPVHVGTMVLRQVVHNLMGHTSTINNPTKLCGDIMDQDMELEVGSNAKNVCFISNLLFFRLMLAYHLNDIELATDLAKKTRNDDNAQMISWIRNFYDGLAAFAAAATATSNERRSMSTQKKERRNHIMIARKNMDKFKKLSTLCSNNFMHKWLLMKAENAALKRGNAQQAIEYYEQAINMAREEGFLLDQALACERAGLYMLRQKNNSDASLPTGGRYLKRAVKLYGEWGAIAKVNQMIDQHRNIDFSESTRALSLSNLLCENV